MAELFASGDEVEANVRGRWFLGKILHVFADNSYSVRYIANHLSPERVPAVRIRSTASSVPTASAVPTTAAAAAAATPERTALTDAERAEQVAKAAQLKAERLEREAAARLQQTVTSALQKLAQHGRARDVEGIISVLTTVPDTAAQNAVNAALVIALGDIAAGLVCKTSSIAAEQSTAVVSARAAHASLSRQASSLLTGLQHIANRDVVKAHECITASLAADSTGLSDYAAAVCDLYTGSGSVSEIDAILKQLQHADTCQKAVAISTVSSNQSASSTGENSAAASEFSSEKDCANCTTDATSATSSAAAAAASGTEAAILMAVLKHSHH
jgi:hypothetical protein